MMGKSFPTMQSNKKVQGFVNVTLALRWPITTCSTWQLHPAGYSLQLPHFVWHLQLSSNISKHVVS